MLDNLVGKEGVASDELINDVKSFCALPPRDMKAIAEVFEEYWLSWVSEDEDAETLKELEKRVESFQKKKDLMRNTIAITSFILKQWVRQDLTREQIMEDLAGLGITSEQKSSIQLLIDAMAKKIDQISEKMLQKTALSVGIPEINSTACVCDLRAVFGSNKYKKLGSQNESYFLVKQITPIVILEIIAELNDTKTTHSFILTEKKLENLFEILERTRKRVEALKKYAGHLLSKEEV
jgi:hypothetical protein